MSRTGPEQNTKKIKRKPANEDIQQHSYRGIIEKKQKNAFCVSYSLHTLTMLHPYGSYTGAVQEPCSRLTEKTQELPYPFPAAKNFPLITSCTATPLILLSSQDITSRYRKALVSNRLFSCCFSLCNNFSSSGFIFFADK
jgi:hypothetical protein